MGVHSGGYPCDWLFRIVANSRRLPPPMALRFFSNPPKLDKHVRVESDANSQRCHLGEHTSCSSTKALSALGDATAVAKRVHELQ